MVKEIKILIPLSIVLFNLSSFILKILSSTVAVYIHRLHCGRQAPKYVNKQEARSSVLYDLQEVLRRGGRPAEQLRVRQVQDGRHVLLQERLAQVVQDFCGK
jgi:hypothetical protein